MGCAIRIWAVLKHVCEATSFGHYVLKRVRVRALSKRDMGWLAMRVEHCRQYGARPPLQPPYESRPGPVQVMGNLFSPALWSGTSDRGSRMRFDFTVSVVGITCVLCSGVMILHF